LNDMKEFLFGDEGLMVFERVLNPSGFILKIS
jgi:hypothetical protein